MVGVLLKAVSGGRFRQVKLLLESGVSVDVADDCGQTALIKAVFLEHDRKRHAITRLLLGAGAKVSKADLVGRDALCWACIYARDKMVAMFLKHGDEDLNLNRPDAQGQTAAYHSVTSGNANIVKRLVDALNKYGLSLDIADNKGITPLMHAVTLGHDICASILIHPGGATVGLNMVLGATAKNWHPSVLKSSDDQLTVPRRPRADDLKSRFPPIVPAIVLQRIKQQEERASHLSVAFPDSDDEDSVYSGFSCSAESDVTSSQRTVSYTSSTEVNAESSDDEPDAFSVPVQEKITFCPSRDLHKMYKIYEDQNSTAYRPLAAKSRSRSRKQTPSQDWRDVRMSASDGREEDSAQTRHGLHQPSEWLSARQLMIKKRVSYLRQDPVTPARFPAAHLRQDPVTPARFPAAQDSDEERTPRTGRTKLPKLLPHGSLVNGDEETPRSRPNYSLI